MPRHAWGWLQALAGAGGGVRQPADDVCRLAVAACAAGAGHRAGLFVRRPRAEWLRLVAVAAAPQHGGYLVAHTTTQATKVEEDERTARLRAGMGSNVEWRVEEL